MAHGRRYLNVREVMETIEWADVAEALQKPHWRASRWAVDEEPLRRNPRPKPLSRARVASEADKRPPWERG
jgi:hypothetical protein